MDFKKGDILIDSGKVYKVTSAGDKASDNGQVEPHVTYELYFQTTRSQQIECTIPVSNLGLTSIRKPYSKAKIKEIIERIPEKLVETEPRKPTHDDNMYLSNNPEDLVPAIKRLVIEKKNAEDRLSMDKWNIYNRLMGSIAGEVAVVLNITPQSAQDKIEAKLLEFVSQS